MSTLEPCPHLPEAEAYMTHACLTELRSDEPAKFYFKALQYGNYLWQKGHAGRAILAVTRALYTDLDDQNPILEEWPLPYAALFWIVNSHPSHDFPGNPRVSFQHQAIRIRGHRHELKRARAWAVWALIRKSKPSLKADLSKVIDEPSLDSIYAKLMAHGLRYEAQLWTSIMTQA